MKLDLFARHILTNVDWEIHDDRCVGLIGVNGAGKSSIGKRLANRLGVSFVDADTEIESAAGMTIPEIFEQHGEQYFRDGEARVIARLLDNGPQVLATGGGAVMTQRTRDLIHIKGISVWLKADLDVLMKRVSKRDHRPLLKEDDPQAVMQQLMDIRYPIYAEADLTIETGNGPHNTAVSAIIEALRGRLAEKP